MFATPARPPAFSSTSSHVLQHAPGHYNPTAAAPSIYPSLPPHDVERLPNAYGPRNVPRQLAPPPPQAGPSNALTLSTTSQQSQQQPKSQSEQLQLAASLVDEQLKADVAGKIDAASALAIPTSSWNIAPATSSSSYGFPLNSRWNPYRRKTYSAPYSLLDQFRTSPSGRVGVGLMPEIGRAWAISEHRLYLWDYLSTSSDASSILTYDEMSDPIVAVGLVAPKKAVFVDAVTHVLVVCTPLLVKLVGLSLGPPPAQGGTRPITLYETERQVLTDGISMVSIASTPGGRIFLSGADGSLRELDYTLAAGWFSANCTLKLLQPGPPASGSWLGKRGNAPPSYNVLLSIDAPRRLLYACTNGTALQAYSYGDDSEHNIGRLSSQGRFTHIAHEASAAWTRRWQHNSPPPADAFFIVAMNVISEADGGSAFGLIATTLCGARLYIALPQSHSSTLRLVHVRAPPMPVNATTPGSGQPRPPDGARVPSLQRVTAAFANGNSGLIAADQQGNLFVATLNAGATRTAIAQKTNAPALAEIADWNTIDAVVHAIAQLPNGDTLLLTTQSTIVLSKTKPSDILTDVLEYVGSDSSEATSFIQSCGDLEGSALCLAIASKLETSKDLSARARKLFGLCADRSRVGPSALALCLGRILQPLWSASICPSPPPGLPTASSLTPTVPQSTLQVAHRDLAGLKALLDADDQLCAAPPPQWQGRPDFAARTAEQSNMASLRQLTTQALEVVSFILLIIVDIQLSEVAAACPPQLLEKFTKLSYRDLIGTEDGRKTANELVTVVINHQISKGQSVDVISNTLEQRCGSICSKDDMLLYKANELLGKAKEAQTPQQQSQLARESSQLFVKAAARLSPERLQGICESYRAVAFLSGAVDLALHCAAIWDPQQLGPSWRADGANDTDPRKPFDAKRQACYDCVIAVLKSADELLNEATDGKGVRSVSDVDALRTAAYNAVLTSSDAGMHTRLYDWLIERHMTEQLLGTRSPYLEAYLRNPPATLEPAARLERLDLLWQYLVTNREYATAAGVLAQLASTSDLPISVSKRLEYLSLASSNARSQFPTNPAARHEMVEFLQTTDERLEVAQVQVEIQHAVSESRALSEEQKSSLLDQLDRQLYTISELYNRFAERLDMPQITLLIFHVSDHRDPERVAELWTRIFEQAKAMPGSATLNIRNKLVELGQRFYPSEAVFPVDDLVSELEQYTSEHAQDAEPGWVASAMHSAGVPLDVLYSVFEALFESRSPPWHTSRALSFVASEALLVLDAWIAQAERARSYGGVDPNMSGASAYEDLPVVDLSRQLDRFASSIPREGDAHAQLAMLKRRLQDLS